MPGLGTVARLASVPALAGALLLGTSLASASPTAAKPTFKVLPKATHGVVPDITCGPDGRIL